MIERKMKAGNLDVKIYDSRDEMGRAAAADVACCIKEKLSEKQEIYMIFAAAPSQNEFLKALSETEGIEWGRVHALHMDEYLNLPADAPQGFGNFLRNAIFSKVPFASVNYIGSEGNPEDVCRNYDSLLKTVDIDIVCMGIGENGHIAFNDPHVADFNDSQRIKIVDLDITCRMQQVHDGCFDKLEDVPQYAVTLTIPEMMSASNIFCIVPAVTKARAVKATVEGPVSESCPASVLKTHPNAVLYADCDSAALLN